MTQPQAIAATAAFCKAKGAIKFFDAGDVQANGFQIVEDDAPCETFTEAGASYMGFAVSALLSGALAEQGRYAVAFTGDGSFTMNPQVLIDGVEHGARGAIVLFDNRRMGAISQLQQAQYGADFRTSDSVPVDYVQMAASVAGVKALSGGYDASSLSAALEEAFAYEGLSLDPRPGLPRRRSPRRHGGLRALERRQLVRRRAGALRAHPDLSAHPEAGGTGRDAGRLEKAPTSPRLSPPPGAERENSAGPQARTARPRRARSA